MAAVPRQRHNRLVENDVHSSLAQVDHAELSKHGTCRHPAGHGPLGRDSGGRIAHCRYCVQFLRVDCRIPTSSTAFVSLARIGLTWLAVAGLPDLGASAP
jgi:hypothetical protein